MWHEIFASSNFFDFCGLLFENMSFYCTYLIKTKTLSMWVLGTFWKSQNTKNHQNAKISCHVVYYAACYSNGSRILFQTKLQKCSQILGTKIVNEFSLSGKWAERFVSLCYWLVFSFQVKQIKRIEWSKWRQSPPHVWKLTPFFHTPKCSCNVFFGTWQNYYKGLICIQHWKNALW